MEETDGFKDKRETMKWKVQSEGELAKNSTQWEQQKKTIYFAALRDPAQDAALAL